MMDLIDGVVEYAEARARRKVLLLARVGLKCLLRKSLEEKLRQGTRMSAGRLLGQVLAQTGAPRTKEHDETFCSSVCAVCGTTVQSLKNGPSQ